MRQDILDIPEHLRDALWKAESAGIVPRESDGLLVCGVGGSAIGGDLAIGALGRRLKRPMVVVRGYELPGFVDSNWTALCSSFSGDTEETVACWQAARERGLRRIVATTGGELGRLARESEDPVIGLPGIIEQPRAAIGYMLVSALAAARAAMAAPSLQAEVEKAAGSLAGQLDDLQARAVALAERVGDRVPVVFGAGLTAPVARRWKGQINENAKRHSFVSKLPEACHNEVVPWGIRPGECSAPDAGEGESVVGPPDVGAADADRAAGGADLYAILLADRDQHPRIRRRIEVLSQMISDSGTPVEVIEAEGGDSRTARLVWAVMLGDFLSLELAARDGIDPAPIPPIDRLKSALD